MLCERQKERLYTSHERSVGQERIRTSWIEEPKPQEAQARFARARLCLPYYEGRTETLRPK